MNISLNIFPKPEPYHNIIVEIYNNNIKALSNAIKNGIDDKNINIPIWINVISILMSSVEKYKNLSGPLKKKVVLEICFITIDQSKLNIKLKNYIKILLNNTLPKLIDSMVTLSKQINIGSNKFSTFIKKIFSCLCKSNKPIPEPNTQLSNNTLSDIITPPPLS